MADRTSNRRVLQLAGQLSEAVAKDERGAGCDIGAGMVGFHVHEWLQLIDRAMNAHETTTPKSNVESLDERRKVLRAMDALEAMSDAWAQTINLGGISANLARRPDINDRIDGIHAMIVQAHMEGLYTGRTSHSSAVEPSEPLYAPGLAPVSAQSVKEWEEKWMHDVPPENGKGDV